jgi:hypothetical protein
VIARLEADRHILVHHRGSGRATSSYTVVMDIHNPRQFDGDDSLTGVSPMSPQRRHRCRPSGDTAVSPDPPMNHQGTTTAPRAHGSAPPVDNQAAEAAGEFFAALGPALTAAQRARLAPLVGAGWDPVALAGLVGANTAGVRSPYAVLRARLSPGELPASPARAVPWPPWCGTCVEGTRRIERADGTDGGRCPRCHPTVAAAGSGGVASTGP